MALISLADLILRHPRVQGKLEEIISISLREQSGTSLHATIGMSALALGVEEAQKHFATSNGQSLDMLRSTLKLLQEVAPGINDIDHLKKATDAIKLLQSGLLDRSAQIKRIHFAHALEQFGLPEKALEEEYDILTAPRIELETMGYAAHAKDGSAFYAWLDAALADKIAGMKCPCSACLIAMIPPDKEFDPETEFNKGVEHFSGTGAMFAAYAAFVINTTRDFLYRQVDGVPIQHLQEDSDAEAIMRGALSFMKKSAG